MEKFEERNVTDVDHIRRLFDQIDDIWSLHASGGQYPKSLLKARLDVMAAVMWSEEQMFYTTLLREKIPMTLANAGH